MKNIWNLIKGWFGTSEPQDPKAVTEIKSIIKNVISVLLSYKEANSDNKVTGMEWLSIGKASLPIIKNIKNYKIVKAQFLDVDSKEGRELVTFCQEQGVFKKDAAAVISHSFNIIEAEISIYKSDIKPIINIIKKR